MYANERVICSFPLKSALLKWALLTAVLSWVFDSKKIPGLDVCLGINSCK